MRDLHRRIARRMSLFAEFKVKILYRPGNKPSKADILSKPIKDKKIIIILNIASEDHLQKVYSYRITRVS